MEKVKAIGVDLRKQLLAPRIFLGRCQLLDKGSRDSLAFQDNAHLPFYFYLGRHLPRDSVINVGFGLGMPLVCYMLANPPVLDMCVQQDPEGQYYHPRLGLCNLRTATNQRPRVFVGELTAEDFHDYLPVRKWGAALVCGIRSYEQALQACESLWPHLQEEGYVCLEGIEASNSVGKAFDNFCRLVNREGGRVRSRYGHGLAFK